MNIIVDDLDIKPQKTASTSFPPATNHISTSMLSLSSDGIETDMPIDEDKALSPAVKALTYLTWLITVCPDKELASTVKVDDMTLVKTADESEVMRLK